MHRAQEKVEIESLKERAIMSDRYRTLKCASPHVDSVGSRGSSKSGTRRKFLDKQFRPTLSERSKQLSLNRNKDRKEVFSALHSEK